MAGQTIGKLTVLERAGSSRLREALWKCQCACGNICIVRGRTLRDGQASCSPQCGARRYELGKNTGSTPVAKVWREMIARCHNPKRTQYRHYGGRGIYVCDRWQDPDVGLLHFLDDMGPRPKGYWIERIDNDGPYSPENCRWADKREQDQNKRNNRWLTANGQTMILSDWARQLGCPPQIISVRLRRGWSVERALTTPTS